ncbi:cytochrome P450 [Bimuria novae-zelandiae CBS 107.79]|uniref:Cytochrome P450 n=1 Tax=Bimuria novae-zelandiae CBS 107.79 TaxID=1447943 RepID=A0A6A5VMW6_9PLEO|nr:cytochrome P450 [Bimuria novae-zelandiae CBS 107.79]
MSLGCDRSSLWSECTPCSQRKRHRSKNSNKPAVSMYTLVLGVSLCALLFYWSWRATFTGDLARIPGPLIARFSNIWKIRAVYHATMHQKNVQLHEKYGSVVRIGPNDVSFASPEALKAIYTARPSFPKGYSYKPTSPLHDGKRLFNLFSVQDVHYHAKLKRAIGSLYTKSVVLELEPRIDDTIKLFMKCLAKRTANGPTELDIYLWLHLFAFDSLGDLNLSERFGFLEKGQDVRGMIETANRILHITGLFGQSPMLQKIQMRIKARWTKTKPNPLLLYTIAKVHDRIAKPTKSPDMLNIFLNLRAMDPDRITLEEIADGGKTDLGQNGGHDVLAVALRTVFYYLARHPSVLERLREEFAPLEKVYSHDVPIPYQELSELTYLDAVIYEAMRVHANIGLILERVVPEGGSEIDGFYIPSGTIVGVNAWVIHHDKTVFGEDAEVFRPERWTEAHQSKRLEMKRFMFSFGDGSRKCIGQNIAMAQAAKVLVEFLRRFRAHLVHPEREWNVHGSWVTKQTAMDMWIARL